MGVKSRVSARWERVGANDGVGRKAGVSGTGQERGTCQ